MKIEKFTNCTNNFKIFNKNGQKFIFPDNFWKNCEDEIVEMFKEHKILKMVDNLKYLQIDNSNKVPDETQNNLNVKN